LKSTAASLAELNPDFAVEIVMRGAKAIQERVWDCFWEEEIL
jgi:hypothetical protein